VAGQFAARSFYRTQRWQSHILTRTANDIPNHYEGIYKWTSTSGVKPVANFETAVPFGATNEVFKAFSAPSLGPDGTVAFVSLGNVSSFGVYAVSPSGVLRRVADTTTAVPGSNVNFADFSYSPSVGHYGEVAFYGNGPASLSGIYAEPNDHSAVSLDTLLSINDLVGGQGIVFIGFGVNAYDSISGRFAAYLVLENTADGIWTFDKHARVDAQTRVMV